MSKKQGSLVVVGTGIRTVGQLTLETVSWIRVADKVFYVVGDPVAEAVIRELNPTRSESLTGLYADGRPRKETYDEMVQRILACVRGGMVTCLACYGHPGVFVYPSHAAIRKAREEGFAAWMLPGISAEDCLFADLGVDPGSHGCQSYEATDFLANARVIDPRSSVILWQAGGLGDPTHRPNGFDTSAIPLLIARLLDFYPTRHTVHVYEAPVVPGCEARDTEVALEDLGAVPISTSSTLYIAPIYSPSTDLSLPQ